MKMDGLPRLLLLVGLGAGLAGCETLFSEGEPRNSGLLKRYDGLVPGKYFRNEAVARDMPLRGLTQVYLKPVQVAIPPRITWLRNAGRLETDLTRIMTGMGRALRQELSTGFIVLQDASFVDRRTIVIEVIATRLSAVNLPEEHPPLKRRLFPTRASAGMEATAGLVEARTRAVRVKDWRSGRQEISRTVPAELGQYGDMLTIFHFWGRRLRDLLLEQTGAKPGRASK